METQRLKSRQGSTRQGELAALKNIWKTKMISKKTKICIFRNNVYATESWKVTKGICHMIEVFQHQVPQMNSANRLAKQNIQCGAPRANWDAAYLARGKEKKMDVDWACQQNATDIHSKSSHALDPSRK